MPQTIISGGKRLTMQKQGDLSFYSSPMSCGLATAELQNGRVSSTCGFYKQVKSTMETSARAHDLHSFRAKKTLTTL